MTKKQKLLEHAKKFREEKLLKGGEITYDDLTKFDVLATDVYELTEDYRRDLSRVLLGVKERSLTEQYLSTFWYVNGDIIGDEQKLSDTDKLSEYGDFIQVDKDHYSIWNKVKHGLPSLKNREYDDFPRGRVLFNTKEQRFKVVASPEIVENHQDELIDWFHLPRAKTDFEADDHYIPVGSDQYVDLFTDWDEN